MITLILLLTAVICSLTAMEQKPPTLTLLPVSKIDMLLSFCHAHMNGLLTRNGETLEFQYYLNEHLKKPIVVKLPFKKACKYSTGAKDKAQYSLNAALQITIINKYIAFNKNTDLPDSLSALKEAIADQDELADALNKNSKDEKYNFDNLTEPERHYLADQCRAENKKLEFLKSIVVKECDNQEMITQRLEIVFRDAKVTRAKIAESFQKNDTELFDRYSNQIISLEQTLKKYQKEE